MIQLAKGRWRWIRIITKMNRNIVNAIAKAIQRKKKKKKKRRIRRMPLNAKIVMTADLHL